MLNEATRRGFKPALLTALGTVLAPGFTGVTRAQTTTNPPPKWETSAGFGLSLTRGNSDTTLVTINAQGSRKTTANEIFLEGDAAYGENTNTVNVETAHAVGQYNHLATDRLYYGLKADYLHDGIAEIRYRYTAMPLVGYYLVKETNTTLSAEAGPGYVIQQIDGNRQNFASLRLGERFEHKFSATAKMWESFEIVPQIDRLGNYYANTEIGAEASLTTHASLRVVFQDGFYNEPAPGKEKNDMKLVAGLQYKF